MYQLVNTLERKYTPSYQREQERKAKVRRQMRKRVAPHADGMVYTINSNFIMARKSQGEITEYSGSSFNRKKYEQKKAKEAPPEPRTKFEKRMVFFHLRPTETRGECLRRIRLAYPKLFRDTIHVLSARSKNKIRSKFDELVSAAGEGRFTFATLSFLSAVDDILAVSVLNNFLTTIRKRHKHFNYIWVAERQTENKQFRDNIHFHVLIDVYLPVAEYNKLWITTQMNRKIFGYSKKLGRKINFDDVRALSARGLQMYLNPFDIKKVKGTKGLKGYLTMYITKNKGSFKCSAWRCSRNVSRLYTTSVVNKRVFDSLKDNDNCAVNKKTGEIFQGQIRTYPDKPFFAMGYILNSRKYYHVLKKLAVINRWILYEKFVPNIGKLTDQEYELNYN